MDEALILERAARRRTLAKIEKLIKRIPSQHIESSELKAAGIRHLPLFLEGNTQHHPRFFEPYQEELPLPTEEKEDELLKSEPDSDHILWDTRAMQNFLTRYFYECWEHVMEEYHNPPPSGVYREYVASHSCFIF